MEHKNQKHLTVSSSMHSVFLPLMDISWFLWWESNPEPLACYPHALPTRAILLCKLSKCLVYVSHQACIFYILYIFCIFCILNEIIENMDVVLPRHWHTKFENSYAGGGARGLLRYGRLHNRLPNLWTWIIISRVISYLWNFILVAWKFVPWQWNKCYIVEMQNYTQNMRNMRNMRNMKEVLHCLLPKTICRICSIWRICKIRPICHDMLQYVLYQLNAEYAQ